MTSHPQPASFDLVPTPEEGHACYECERRLAIAKRELNALATAVRVLFGEAEADRVTEDWLLLVEDRNVSFADEHSEWRGITAAAIVRLAARCCPSQNELQ